MCSERKKMDASRSSVSEITALAALLALEGESEPLAVERAASEEDSSSIADARARRAHLEQFISSALDDNAPIPALSPREYLRGLPDAVRRRHGSAGDGGLDADDEEGPMLQSRTSAASGGSASEAPPPSTAPPCREAAVAPSAVEAAAADAAFSGFLEGLPPEARKAARKLQELGELSSATAANISMTESEHYRSYMELLERIEREVGAGAPHLEPHADTEASAAASSGVKRKRGAETAAAVAGAGSPTMRSPAGAVAAASGAAPPDRAGGAPLPALQLRGSRMTEEQVLASLE